MIDSLMSRPLPEIPADIEKSITCGSVTFTDFDKKNSILTDSSLSCETGYAKDEKGNFLVSMVCPMPGITKEMIEWWFWWHPQHSKRYKVWFPGEHFAVSFSKKDKEYFSQKNFTTFKENTQFPFEKIGKIIMPLRIDFISPESFGFSDKAIKSSGTEVIVCGHVSALWGLVPHTEMAHIFKKTDDALVLISRFWLGKNLKNPILRKAILTKGTAEGMARHCCIEYRSLAEILPALYEKYALR